MKVFRAAAIALAMYSKIPVPQFDWKDEDMRYAICFFPLVGLVIGAILYGWLALSSRLGIGNLAVAVVGVLIPVIVTGGIHVDGFMDTSDALSSWQTKERRLEILKDSHIGAFSVIMLAVFGGLYLAAASEIVRASDPKRLLLWCLTFFYGRTLSGGSVVFFKNAKKEGTLYAFASRSHRKTSQGIMIGEAVLGALLLITVSPFRGAVCVTGGALTCLYYRHRAYRDFGGITGDLAGWFLCLAELVMAVVLAAG